ncbi:MAG: hypothetical protein V4687_18100 [Bacteroidota bacterium]
MNINALKFVFTLQIIFSICIASTMAQKPKPKPTSDSTIILSGKAGLPGGTYDITINKANGVFRLLYVVNDSLNEPAINNDKKYKRLFKILEKGEMFGVGTNDKHARDYAGLIRKYQVRSVDSLLFHENDNSSFNKLFKDICATDIKELNTFHGSTLDGFTVHVETIVPGKTQFIFVNSPNLTYHPLLTQLLSQTVGIYNASPNKDLISRTSIKDY